MPDAHAGISIGFVGGGRMAQALAQGIGDHPQFAEVPVFFTDPSDEPAAAFQDRLPRARRCTRLESLVDQASLIWLAVKPQVMPAIFPPLAAGLSARHLVVSVAAGISIATCQAALGTSRVIRVMPNTPCLIGHGMSAMSADETVSPEDRETVRRILESVGKVVPVKESQLDAVTGLSGSGPAYVFSFIQALISGGVAQGLSPELARQLTVQTVVGAARLVESSGLSPEELTSQVTSPGGTTLAGLEPLQAGEFTQAVENAIAAATQRSIELSRT